MPNVQCLSCGYDIYLDQDTYVDYQGAVTCPTCKGRQDVVIQKKRLVTASLYPDIYEPIREILGWDIPEDILYDLAEATLDLGVNAFKSCVVMCRRCMHAVLLEKQIDDDPSLEKMIGQAVAKRILTQEQQETAHAVRFFGVTGAHPKDQTLRKVTKLQAQLSIEVTKGLLMELYPPRQLEMELEPLELGSDIWTGGQSEIDNNEQLPYADHAL